MITEKGICPKCKREMLRGDETWVCEKCLCRIPFESPLEYQEDFEVGQEPSEEIQQGFAHAVITSFPYPIACVYADLDDPRVSLARKQQALFFTVYQLMRCVALPFISVYLQKETFAPNLEKKRADFNYALMDLRSPFFSSWIHILTKIAKEQKAFELNLFDDVIAAQIPENQAHKVESFASFIKLLTGEKIAVPVHNALKTGGARELHLLDAFLGLRNGTQHSGRSLDEACLEDLRFYRPILDKLLTHFRWLEHCRILELDGPMQEFPEPIGNFLILKGFQPGVSQPMSLTESLFHALKESPIVMGVPQSRPGKELFVPLYPLFFGPLQGESLQLYDGHYLHSDENLVRRTVIYLGTGKRSFLDDQDSEPISSGDYPRPGERLHQLLEKQKVVWELSKKDLKPWALQDCASDFSRRTFEDQLQVKYFPECFLEREVPFRSLRAFTLETPIKPDFPYRGLIITGSAGSGKTSLIMHLTGQILREGRHAVFFLRGDGISSFKEREWKSSGPENMLFQNLTHKMALKAKDFSGFRDLFQRLKDGSVNDEQRDEQGKPDRRFIFLFDAVNESPQFERIIAELIEMVRDSRDFPFVRIVMTIRTEAFEVLVRRKFENEANPFSTVEHLLYPNSDQTDSDEIPSFSCPPFVLGEAGKVYRKYQKLDNELDGQASPKKFCLTPWDSLKPSIQRFLCCPLYLHLFHETFAGRFPEEVNEEPAELFEAYLAQKVKRTVGLRSALERLTKMMLKNRRPDFTDADAHELKKELQNSEWTQEEQRFRFNPLEICEMEGIIQKRVTEEGGGHRIPIQAIREFLLFQEFKRQYPNMSAQNALEWIQKAPDYPGLPEYSAVLGFVMRSYVRLNRSKDAAVLFGNIDYKFEAGLNHMTATLRNEILATENNKSSSGISFVIAMIRMAEDFDQDKIHNLCNWVNFDLFNALENNAMLKTLRLIIQTNIAAIEKTTRKFPDSVQATRDFLVSYNNLGIIEEEFSGNANSGRNYFQKVHAISEELYRKIPNNAQIACDLAYSYDNLGVMEEAQGNLDVALTYYQKGFAIRAERYRKIPNNSEAASDLSISLNNLGHLKQALGDLEAALDLFKKGLAIDEELYHQRPDSVDAARALLVSYNNLGNIDKIQGNLKAALSYFKKCLVISERLHQKMPDCVQAEKDLCNSYHFLERIEELCGDHASSKKYQQKRQELEESIKRKGTKRANEF